jgi:hypothetical protein
MRREFVLPENDVDFLDNSGYKWETITDKGMQWVIIHDYTVASGYHQQTVNIAIKIDTGYPRAQLDMAYFFPPLQRLDGKSINATCPQIIDGISFQRWSRHRTPQNPWREDVDDLSTHVSLICFWFEQEFIKKPNEITT